MEVTFQRYQPRGVLVVGADRAALQRARDRVGDDSQFIRHLGLYLAVSPSPTTWAWITGS